MTVDNPPSLAEWRRLYDAWLAVRDMAPWEWMLETHVFGVQHPDDADRLGFVSVMGNVGEHYAVALYQGVRALYQFWELQNAGPQGNPFMLFEIPQLQASLEDRTELENQDRAIIKDLGLKFRGKQAWPMFRSLRPGFVPWFMDADEARFLAIALEQLLEVAPRVQTGLDLLTGAEGDQYLMRVPRPEGDQTVWEDSMQRLPSFTTMRLHMPMDVDLLEQVKALPQERARFELDLFLIPSPIQEERDQRPFFPYALLMVDGRTGAIVGHEMLAPEPDLESIWERVPLAVLQRFAEIEMHPNILYVANARLGELLARLGEELDCRITVRRNLRHLQPAKMGLMSFLRGT